MRYLQYLVLFFVCSPVFADIYIDVGLGVSKGYSYQGADQHICVLDTYESSTCRTMNTYKESTGITGLLEIGYTHKKLTVFVLHLSDTETSEDPGINMIGVKYRFTIK